MIFGGQVCHCKIGRRGSHFFATVLPSFSILKKGRKYDKKSFNFGIHSLSLQIQIKYFAIKKQKLICSSYLELSGLRPKAASASRDLESFSMILPDCSHENKLFQKDWVFSHVQNRCNRCSVSFRQKVHFSLSVNPNLCKKLLVDSRRCRNLKLKTISFELFVQ